MACASLAMYDLCPAVQAANDALWRVVRDDLREAGFTAPDNLDRASAYDASWRKPDLVLAQTCGFPFVKLLRGAVRLVGVPVFRFPGGRGADRSSFVVVRDAGGSESLEQLRDSRIAMNDPMSNSGMNLLRALVAPHAVDGRFFRSVIITGSHVASIAAVRDNRADVAAIDSVTYGLLALHQPETIAGLRVLVETPAGPGLPLITRMDASDEELAVLRGSLLRIVADPRHAPITQPLGLSGFEVVDSSAFETLADLEASAIRQGYPVIN